MSTNFIDEDDIVVAFDADAEPNNNNKSNSTKFKLKRKATTALPIASRDGSPPRRPRGEKLAEPASPPRRPKPQQTGASAGTIYRDSKGRIIDIEEEKKRLEEEKRVKEGRIVAKQENMKGSLQIQKELDKQKEFQKMQTAPFSRSVLISITCCLIICRSVDDKELNLLQKSKTLWDDPMKSQVADKQQEGSRLLVYRGNAPPNRFGIRPGYRWDGVDRSNGFENIWFKKKAEEAALKAEAYKWSTEDM